MDTELYEPCFTPCEMLSRQYFCRCHDGNLELTPRYRSPLIKGVRGILPLFLYYPQNLLTDSLITFINFSIRKTKNLQSELFQYFRSIIIICLLFITAMGGFIHFYNEVIFRTIEIYDKLLYRFLSIPCFFSSSEK